MTGDAIRGTLGSDGSVLLVDPIITNGSGVANDDALWFQLVSPPIGAQTISGTFKGVLSVREDNAAIDARAQLTLRVLSGDGTTVRGTLLALDTAAIGTDEFGTSFATFFFPRGGAQSVSSVVAQSGDRIVLEVGFRNVGTNTNTIRARLGAGSVTDFAFTEGLTTNLRPWFEFSQTIAPYENRAIVVNGVDQTDVIRHDSFNFTESAEQGSVGIGGFNIDDAAAAIDIPALKPVVFTDPRASEMRVFTGFTQERITQRGPNRVAGQREWDVEVVDINTLFDDYVMTGSGANRSGETDYARVTWLLTTALNTVGGVTAGVVPNSNTVDMDAVDYRGRKARDVIAECAEASGKNYFLYYHTSSLLLFYDLHTSSSLASSARISDVAADVDSSVTWAAIGPPKVRKNPDRVHSTVHFKYKRGTVIVSNATTLSNFRHRDVAVTDLSAKTLTKATAKANRFLDGAAASENVTVSEVSVDVPAENVNDIRAGHRIEIKLTRHGISTFTWYRILRRTITATTDVRYRITLTLADTVLPSIFVHGRGGEDIWEEKSNATEDDATVIVDGGGITVTNGAITVTNGAAIVIIDGTSNMFKIAAEGTQSTTATADSNSIVSTTLTALGALAAGPASALFYANTSGSTSEQHPSFYIPTATNNFAAASSGGSPTVKFSAIRTYATGDIKLNGSDEAVVRLVVINPYTSDATVHQKYFILQETVF